MEKALHKMKWRSCGLAISRAEELMNANRADSVTTTGLVIPDAAIVGGISPAIRALQLVIADLAATETPLLILGESGSGKKTAASLIHNLSRRRHEPFTVVSCATQDDSFFRADGHGEAPVTAAFFRQGTVLLHNVTELSSAGQASLLKALVSESGRTTVRLMSTSTESVEQAVRSGCFIEELSYRISGVHVRVPPLRNRKEDIPIMVQWFLQKHAGLVGMAQARTISPATLRYLVEYPWPGNITQLDEVIRSIAVSGDEETALAELAADGPVHEAGPSVVLSLKECSRSASQQAERKLILQALMRTHWNKKKAAQELQISYKALLYKLKKIGANENAVVSEEHA
jgi:two-component system response regulator AtoC